MLDQYGRRWITLHTKCTGVPCPPHLVQHFEFNDQGACVVRCRTDQVPAPHIVPVVGSGPLVLGHQGEAGGQELR